MEANQQRDEQVTTDNGPGNGPAIPVVEFGGISAELTQKLMARFADAGALANDVNGTRGIVAPRGHS